MERGAAPATAGGARAERELARERGSAGRARARGPIDRGGAALQPGEIRGCAFEGGPAPRSDRLAAAAALGLPEVAASGARGWQVLDAQRARGVRKAAPSPRRPGARSRSTAVPAVGSSAFTCARSLTCRATAMPHLQGGPGGDTRFLDDVLRDAPRAARRRLIVDVQRSRRTSTSRCSRRGKLPRTCPSRRKSTSSARPRRILEALGALNAALALRTTSPSSSPPRRRRVDKQLWSAILDALVNNDEERRR